MAYVSVFAGLGSEALFSTSTIDQAARDASTRYGRLLLEACHRCFLVEISHGSGEQEGSLGVDLDDFQNPRDLLKPCQRYHRNAIVQHGALCAIQMLRYLYRHNGPLEENCQRSVAVAGFCAGLFPAVAAATSMGLLQYLSRAEQCFRLAVLLGIASERSRREINVSDSRSPWSLVVDGVSADEMAQILSSYSPNKESPIPVYVSSINAHSCVTVSAEGSALRKFVEDSLSSQCRVRPTNLYSLYHNRQVLSEAKEHILADFRDRKLQFPACLDLEAPVISTLDGSMVARTQDSSPSQLLNLVLDMTLLDPTDWVAVQKTILSKAQDVASSMDCSVQIHNYGPGYGALKGRKDLPENLQVLDMSSERCTQDPATPLHSSEDIAIVGMGVDLPGAPNLSSLWQNLMGGVNACSEIPANRFHVEDYYSGEGAKPVNPNRSMATKFGNFLSNPFEFDNAFFDISPREARSIDPQQRVMLQTAYRALESAGYVPDSSETFDRETFGCFIGNATLDYTENLRDEIDVYYSPGTLRAFLAGRISYAFGWSGPSLTIDTACSSSLVAMYQASRALLAGDCKAAIAGGVNIVTSPDMYLGLDRAHFLSSTGQCKAFDQSADGYCRAEGCAAFVLKRLGDAIAENDHILGVIKGIEVNQSGTTHSITHPHSPTQERLFRRLLARTTIDPHDISVVEAHGTGTQAGDPNEVGSLRGVLCKSRDPRNPLHITSIKANIGHCEAASGGAALAKLLLMLRHSKIPPQPLLETLNPSIEELGTDGALINQQAASWTVPDGKHRLALLNNFGAAGSNAAMILQEHIQPRQSPVEDTSEDLTYCFGCSAKDEKTLVQLKDDFLSYLETNTASVAIDDLCYTSVARRQTYNFRVSTTASSTTELAQKLKHAKVVEVAEQQLPVVFLFSGQGSQYLGMGQELMTMFPDFAKTVMRCHSLLVRWGMPSCLDVMTPSSETKRNPEDLSQLQAFQTAVFVLEIALGQLLMGFGVKPDVVSGHSLGEYAALVVAGVMDLESGLRLVASRARLIVQRCELNATSMLAVNSNAQQIKEVIEADQRFVGLTVSCENSPGDCVIGGEVEKLRKFKEHLGSSQKTKLALLEVPIAYHTAALDPILEGLKELANELALSAPKIRVASNVLGRVIDTNEDAFSPDYFAQHCRQTVAFDKSIEDIIKSNESFANGHWIEVGPHPALLSMISSRLSGPPSQRLSVLRKDKSPSETMATLLSFMYVNGADLDWRKIFESQSKKPLLSIIPTMPFNLKEYSVPLRRAETTKAIEDSELSHSVGTPYRFLAEVVEMPPPDSSADALFDTPVQYIASYIEGHMVCDYALCPASVYQEMAVSAAKFLDGDGAEGLIYKVTNISFSRPLLYFEGSTISVRTLIKSKDAATGVREFDITSYDTRNGPKQLQYHCHGNIKTQAAGKAVEKLKRKERTFSRRKAMFLNGAQAEGQQTFSGKTMYEKIFTRVVRYSSLYRAVQSIKLDEAADEVLATCQLPRASGDEVFATNPVLMDTLLHVAGFAANLNVDDDDVCICNEVSSAIVLRKDLEADRSFEVHCSNFSDNDTGTVLADAYALDSDGIIAAIKGMQFHRAKLSKMQAAFKFSNRENRESPEGKTKPQTNKSASIPPTPPESEQSKDGVADDQPTNDDEDTRTSSPNEQTASGQRSVTELVAETCGVEAKEISPQTKLEGLGIDSLMIYELEEKLQTALHTEFDSSELKKCETVGDVEGLATPASSKTSTPRLKGRDGQEATNDRSRSSPQNSSASVTPVSLGTSRCSSPQSPRESRRNSAQLATAGHPPELDISPKMQDMLRRRLKLNEQPEIVQRPPSKRGPSETGSSVYFVHPGAGFCSFYHRLLPLHRATFAIHDPKVLNPSSDIWKTIKEVATEYAKLLMEATKKTPESPLILSGWSFGGIVAYEVATKILASQKRQVAGVLLVDAPPPLNHQPLSQKTVDAAMSRKLQRPNRRGSASEFEKVIAQLTVRNNLRAAALLKHYEPNMSGPKPKTILLRSREGFKVEGLDLPKNEWLDDRSNVRTAVAGWEAVVGDEVRVMDIPGTHFDTFDSQNIDEVSRKINDACEMLEAS